MSGLLSSMRGCWGDGATRGRSSCNSTGHGWHPQQACGQACCLRLCLPTISNPGAVACPPCLVRCAVQQISHFDQGGPSAPVHCRGKCARGASCRYSHVDPRMLSNSSLASPSMHPALLAAGLGAAAAAAAVAQTNTLAGTVPGALQGQCAYWVGEGGTMLEAPLLMVWRAGRKRLSN